MENNYYMSDRREAFEELFENTHPVIAECSHFYYHDLGFDTGAYDFDVYTAWPPSGTPDPVGLLTYDAKFALESIANDVYVDPNGKPLTFTDFNKTIYVPENIPESQRDQLQADMQKAKAELEAYAKELGLENFDVTFYLDWGTGTYDYENGSTNIYDEIHTP